MRLGYAEFVNYDIVKEKDFEDVIRRAITAFAKEGLHPPYGYNVIVDYNTMRPILNKEIEYWKSEVAFDRNHNSVGFIGKDVKIIGHECLVRVVTK